jgi:hypothetical protein
MVARFVAPVLLFLACVSSCGAQPPIPVTPCDLVNSPAEYTGKVVAVRAHVNLAFEDFSLAQGGCEDAYPGVWLVYGGDEPTPTASTVNDLSRKPGSVLKVNGRPIPLVHDEALDMFRQRLGAIRISPIGDQPCYDCHLYRVTATLTGVFFAAPKGQLDGYGHLGCCHLLAIQQVSDIDAERTPIPMGGTFRCVSENRILDAPEANRFKAFERPCGDLTFQQCQDLRLQQIATAAKHWNDPIRPEDGTLDLGEIAGNTLKDSWKSADRLKTYTVSIQSNDPTKMESEATGGVVTRETCQATVPPLPMSTVVSCRNLWSEFPANKDNVERIAESVAAGREAWRRSPATSASRQALDEAAKTWRVPLAKEILSADCEKPMVYQGDQFIWCGLTARDGMQSFSIQITRFGYLRNGKSWATVPWFLTRGKGVSCTTAP